MPFVMSLLFAASLGFDSPDGWDRVSTTNPMRLAQWTLPGTPEPAEVVIFYFGEGQGGSVQANLARWMGQFEQPDGSRTEDKAVVSERETNGLKVTVADIRGTYVASVRPGSTERHQRPGYRMIAAVAEGDGGPWFIRFLGSEETIGRWEESIDGFLDSLRASVRME